MPIDLDISLSSLLLLLLQTANSLDRNLAAQLVDEVLFEIVLLVS
jgi:hypothetical protein